jgi:hypothetical protein
MEIHGTDSGFITQINNDQVESVVIDGATMLIGVALNEQKPGRHACVLN